MALTNKLTAIANAIRAKTGGSAQLSLDDMVTEIGNISGGSAAVIESKNITENGTYTAPSGVDGYSPIVVNVPSSFPNITFSGNISNLNYFGLWDTVFENYSNKLITQNITAGSSMMFKSSVEDLSGWTINFSSDGSLEQIFYNAGHLKQLPTINKSGTILSLYNTFQNCELLRYIPNNYFSNMSFSQTSKNNVLRGTFSNCKSLRKLPTSLRLSDICATSTLTSTSKPFADCFSQCYVLEEIQNFPCLNATVSNKTASYLFGNGFLSLSRLKTLTFNTNNGEPLVRSWTGVTIDCRNMGYSNNDNYITGYNSGITVAKKVTDAASYETLKNDPDWYTINSAYSRYNHDSAVETINSLPDTSAYLATAGGTNTIQFKTGAGSATDAGAVSDMTAAEIAVATNKGWTVTFA